MQQGQNQGSVIAQVVIDVNSDTIIGGYGIAPSGLTVITPKTEYTFALDAETSAAPANGAQPIPLMRTSGANPYRTARIYVGALDLVGVQRVQIVDAAGAPAVGAAGDVLFVSVLRATVPGA